jgi:hypothetical protein
LSGGLFFQDNEQEDPKMATGGNAMEIFTILDFSHGPMEAEL